MVTRALIDTSLSVVLFFSLDTKALDHSKFKNHIILDHIPTKVSKYSLLFK